MGNDVGIIEESIIILFFLYILLLSSFRSETIRLLTMFFCEIIAFAMVICYCDLIFIYADHECLMLILRDRTACLVLVLVRRLHRRPRLLPAFICETAKSKIKSLFFLSSSRFFSALVEVFLLGLLMRTIKDLCSNLHNILK